MQSYFNLKEKLISAEEGRISEDIKKKANQKRNIDKVFYVGFFFNPGHLFHYKQGEKRKRRYLQGFVCSIYKELLEIY